MDLQGVSPIGQQVARYRKAAKMSGEELAQKAGEGLTRSVIANLENGRKEDITVRQLMALSAALHVPPALLIADAFDPGAPSPYPLPERIGTLPEGEEDYDNVGSLLGWIGGFTFRAQLPIHAPAPKLAYDAFIAVRTYLNAAGRLRRLVRNYALATEHRDDDYLYFMDETIQNAAEDTLRAIQAMEQAGVALSGAATEMVHDQLAKAGLKYNPVPDDLGAPDFDG